MSGISAPGSGVNINPNGSFTIGTSVTSTGAGDYSVALGSFTAVTTYSTAVGGGAVADVQGAVALGLSAAAHAQDSIAVLGTVTAGGDRSVAIGSSASVGSNASGSVALGQSSVVAGAAARAVAVGYSATANHADAVALGTGAATGEQYDIALGVVPNGTTTHSHVSVNGEYLRFGYKNASAADPAAPAAGKALLYLRDNGAGKGQLVVRFPTGAVQVLATEP